MIKPMLAAPRKRGTVTDWTDWVVEEKYDGNRWVVCVELGSVTAYTRPRSNGVMNLVNLPPHLVKELARLPNCVIDGEGLAGDISTDVKRNDLAHTLRFVVFDVLELHGARTTTYHYDARREMLERMFRSFKGTHVRLSTSVPAISEENVTRCVKAIWAAGGEGVILKRRRSTYHVGKRTPDWIKIKRQEHAALTLVGFERSRGTVRFPRHPFAIVKLRDDDGNEATAKVRDDHELARIVNTWRGGIEGRALPLDEKEAARHPWVRMKRRLVIEFQQRTRDGGYRGPVIWDRWEDE